MGPIRGLALALAVVLAAAAVSGSRPAAIGSTGRVSAGDARATNAPGQVAGRRWE
jgi:hypothetical protein